MTLPLSLSLCLTQPFIYIYCMLHNDAGNDLIKLWLTVRSCTTCLYLILLLYCQIKYCLNQHSCVRRLMPRGWCLNIAICGWAYRGSACGFGLLRLQGPVVQSTVSVTSSLMTNSLIVVAVTKVFSNTLIFFAEKM